VIHFFHIWAPGSSYQLIRPWASGSFHQLNPTLGPRSCRRNLSAFPVAGPRLWNSLPSNLRQSDLTLYQFHRTLKTYLFGWLGLQHLVTVVFNVLYKCSYLSCFLVECCKIRVACLVLYSPIFGGGGFRVVISGVFLLNFYRYQWSDWWQSPRHDLNQWFPTGGTQRTLCGYETGSREYGKDAGCNVSKWLFCFMHLQLTILEMQWLEYKKMQKIYMGWEPFNGERLQRRDQFCTLDPWLNWSGWHSIRSKPHYTKCKVLYQMWQPTLPGTVTAIRV